MASDCGSTKSLAPTSGLPGAVVGTGGSVMAVPSAKGFLPPNSALAPLPESPPLDFLTQPAAPSARTAPSATANIRDWIVLLDMIFEVLLPRPYPSCAPRASRRGGYWFSSLYVPLQPGLAPRPALASTSPPVDEPGDAARTYVPPGGAGALFRRGRTGAVTEGPRLVHWL